MFTCLKKTYVEMRKCKQPKQDIMFDFLAQIDFTEIAVNDEIRSVAQQIIDLGILTQKSFDDCIHIASAVVGNCDIIVSWNFQHMVNVKTIRGVRGIANINGYNNIDIMQPTMLISNENEEE